MIGRIIGTFRITQKLGEGGMGSVYRAIDQMVEREVAIKVLHPEFAQNPEFGERFRTEAIALARLNHPAVATLYTFFREGDESFMVMEFVPGETLESRIRREGAMQWQQAVEVLLWSLDGVRHAHQMGILHRDLKPANIMITPDGRVKVTDFGIARIANSVRHTREARVVGTIEYLAPERALGKPADARSDIYSLGVVFYEMLTGRLPFHADTDFALMRAQVEDIPKLPSELGVHIPAPIEKALMGALAKNPDHRYPDAATFAAQFREAVRVTGMPLSSRPTRLAKDGPPPPPPPPPAVLLPPVPGVRHDMRKTGMIVGVGLAVFLLAAVAGIGVMNKPWQKEPVPVVKQEGGPAAPPQDQAPLQPIAPVVTIPGSSGNSPVVDPTPPPADQPVPRVSSPAPPPAPVASRPSPITPSSAPRATRETILAALEQTDRPVPAGSSPGMRPLHYVGILKAVQLGGPSGAPVITESIQRRGVNFRVAADQIIELHAAGAPDPLIQMLPAAYRADQAGTAVAAVPPPSVAPPPSSAPVNEPPAGPPIRRLREVRRIAVESKQKELAGFLREELESELGARVTVVRPGVAADVVLRVEVAEEQSGKVVGTAGRVFGMKGKLKAVAQVVDRRHGNIVWSAEVGDRQAVMGAFGDGARRVASRIAKQLHKEWDK